MPATNTMARSASSITNSVNINNSIVMGNTSALATQGPRTSVPPPLSVRAVLDASTIFWAAW
eukprot:8361357-Heterocapsa_arctica.AAC.1